MRSVGRGGCCGNNNEYLEALNATTGASLWSYGTGYSNTMGPAAPVVGNGGPNGKATVFFSCSPSGGPSGVCAVDASSGTFDWGYTVGSGNTNIGLTYAMDGVLYVNGGSSGEIVALNPTNGAVIWNVTASYSSQYPISFANSALYVPGSDGDIHVLRKSNGAPVWNAATRRPTTTRALRPTSCISSRR